MPRIAFVHALLGEIIDCLVLDLPVMAYSLLQRVYGTRTPGLPAGRSQVNTI